MTLRFSAPKRDIACGTARREGRRPSAFVDSTTYMGISFSLAEAVVRATTGLERCFEYSIRLNLVLVIHSSFCIHIISDRTAHFAKFT